MKAAGPVLLALGSLALAQLAFAASASALALSSPNGMKTVSNTPSLAWTQADDELADMVRVSTAAATDPATGELKVRYTSLDDQELTTDGVNAGNTSEWADSDAAPLWPGTYFWQVHYITTNADGSTAQAWSAVRKVVVQKFFRDDLPDVTGLLVTNGNSASSSNTIRIHTNAKTVPVKIVFRMNGHVFCTVSKPFTRTDDLDELVATSTATVKLKASYYRRGTNVETFAGFIGSAATTGRVERIDVSHSFQVK